MKRIVCIPRLVSVFSGFALAASLNISRADVTVNTFETSTEVSTYGYQNWNGSATGTESFSTNQSTISGSAASGSMQISVVYGGSGQNGGTFVRSDAPVDLSKATGIEFDAMIDPNSPLDNNGNAMEIKAGFNGPSYNSVIDQWIGTTYAPMTPGVWHHFTNSFTAGTLTASSSQFFLQCMNYSYDGTPYTPIVYIDNIKIDVPPNNYPNYVAYNGFKDATTVDAQTNWYGHPVAISWSTNDANGDPNSGSAYIVAQMSPGDNNIIIGLPFDTNYVAGTYSTTNAIDGTHFTNVEMDVKWDANNSTVDLDAFNSYGDISGFPLGILTSGFNQVEAFGTAATAIPDTASNGWVHLSFPTYNHSLAGLDQTIGLWFKKYEGSGEAGQTAFWIDNVVFDGGPVSVPSPAMSISKPTKGLNIVGTIANQYGREGLVTFNDNYNFVDQGAPTTYALNIGKAPPSGFITHIFLVPGSPTEAEPDWTEPNILYVDIEANADGSGFAIFRCKTNAPNGNGGGTDNLGGYYSSGDGTNVVNPQVNSSTILGTWAVTFNNNTSITMTSPDGSTTNFAFPFGMTSGDVEAYFGGGMGVYYGIMPNNTANVGSRVVLSSVGITNGATSLLYDNFTTDTTLSLATMPGDTNLWLLACDDATPAEACFITPSSLKYYITWPSPASGFILETNALLSDSAGWSTNTGLSSPLFGATYEASVDASNLPPSGNLFFRLIKP